MFRIAKLLAVVAQPRKIKAGQVRFLARGRPGPPAPTAPPPAPSPVDPWEEVKDASGQIYYWNTQTDETTALGAPRPTTYSLQQQQQQQPLVEQQPGLGTVMAQGMAFGAGSAIAHNVIGSAMGSMFGGGDSGGGGGGGSDDEFDL